MSIQCVILAGGLGERLRPFTEKVPKSMMEIKGRPFLEYQIELLQRNNVNEALLCVGYLGELIENYFGDGKKVGMKIRYSYELGNLLGTGGAIKNASNLLNDGFLVMYGDSYLEVNYEKIYNYFLQNGSPALLTVYKNKNKWDRSNVFFRNGVVEVYDKKNQFPEMEYIDFGLAALTRKVIDAEIPRGIFYDLADLYHKLAGEKKLAGYEIFTRFYEVGSKQGLEEFQDFISERGVAR